MIGFFIFRMRKVATAVSLSLVALFLVLSIWENGLFKLHPSLMAVGVSTESMKRSNDVLDHSSLVVSRLHVSSDLHLFNR